MKFYVAMERSRLRSWTIGFTVLVAVVMFGLVLWQGANRPDSSVSASSPVLLQDRAEVLSDRTSLLTLPEGDVTVLVPCCSLGVGGTVSMVESEPNLFPDPAGQLAWSRPRIVNIEYYSPAGELVPYAISSTPVEICFSLTEEQWLRYQTHPENFAIQYYDNQRSPGKWKSMQITNREQQRSLCTKSGHLTLFALAIQQELMPVTGSNEPYTP